jgi:hypothetical protein
MNAANELEADDGAVHGFWAFVIAVRAARHRADGWNPDRLEHADEFLAAVAQFEREPPQ